MDWLKDKKNQPIAAGILIGVILIVGFCVWFFMLRKPADQAAPMDASAQTAAPAATGAPVPGDASATPPATGQPGDASATAPAASTPGAPGQPAAAGTAASAPAGTNVAAVTPMETWRSDPFQPIGYKGGKKGPQPKPHIRDFPFERLPVKVVWDKNGEDVRKMKPEIQQPSRRMAGILLNDRVYAILESGGTSQVVQPGDYTLDRLAMVERIEPDRVVLKTVDAKPRYITVKMAASPTIQSASTASPSGPMPAPMAPGPRGPVPMNGPRDAIP